MSNSTSLESRYDTREDLWIVLIDRELSAAQMALLALAQRLKARAPLVMALTAATITFAVAGNQPAQAGSESSTSDEVVVDVSSSPGNEPH